MADRRRKWNAKSLKYGVRFRKSSFMHLKVLGIKRSLGEYYLNGRWETWVYEFTIMDDIQYS